MSGPLSHLRILDLSRVLAGPWATQLLGDLGAEVIKVEKPGEGDDTRRWGPPFAKDRSGAETTESAYFLSANRGKRSVTIDFTRPEGQRLVRELAMRADAVVENFKTGGLQKFGLDYRALKSIKPDIVYCSITGFGQTGPYAHRAGYDFLAQGMGGLMSITGDPDGEPMKVGVALTDVFTGMYASVAILAALSNRDRTGEGQHIDLSLLDVQVAVLANQATNYLVSGRVPPRLGNAHPNIVPYQAFATSDGYIILAVGNDSQFRRACEVLQRPEWADDPRFVTNAARVANRTVLVPLLHDALVTHGSAEWLNLFEKAGVPCGPINSLDRVFTDPQVRERGMVIDMDHPLADGVQLVANPIHLSATPIRYDRPPPCLGADTDEILERVLGLSAAEIDSFRAAKVI